MRVGNLCGWLFLAAVVSIPYHSDELTFYITHVRKYHYILIVNVLKICLPFVNFNVILTLFSS